jgi:molybdopterin-containing oxidoreductase family membrane subunit
MTRSRDSSLTDDLLRPVMQTSAKFYVTVAVLAVIVATGFGAWFYQVYNGLGVTGDNWPVFWGFHETNFVFWIGISHAGTLISAILRIVNATWRRPVTRCAEVITAFALMIGAVFPIVHLGRPWLAWWLIPYPSERGLWPNYRSPLVWDFFAINTYLISSLLFLALPAIPDFRIDSRSGNGLAKVRLRKAGNGMARELRGNGIGWSRRCI